MLVLALVGLIIGFLAGIALAYQLLERRLTQQRREHLEQTRQAIEDLEKMHETRMQKAIEPIRAQYEAQLAQNRQTIAELESANATRIQEMTRSLQQQHDTELQQHHQAIEDLKAAYETRIHDIIHSMRQEYESQPAQPNPVTGNSYEARVQDILQSMQAEAAIVPNPDEPIQPEQQKTGNSYEARVEDILESMRAEYEPNPKLDDDRLYWEEGDRSSTAQPSEVAENSYEARVQNILETMRQEYEVTNIPERQTNEPNLASSPTPNATEVATVPAETAIATRTTSLNFDELRQNIVTWGNSRQIRYLSQLLSYTNHPNAQVRQVTATALGNLVTTYQARSLLDRSIQALGKLSQDSKPQVRQAAIEALAKIRSERVLPLLQKALRDPVSSVARVASQAMGKFNYGYNTKPKTIEIKKPRK